jgi:hypothetical protein
MSPEGWYRTKIWYESLAEPPEPDSLQETLAVMYLRLTMKAQLVRDVALFHALGVKGKHLTTVRKILTSGVFPFMDQEDDEFDNQVRDALQKWISGGPIVIPPKAVIKRIETGGGKCPTRERRPNV